MSEFYNNSIFWVEVDRISPNPYQPRKEFNDEKIAELADSIRQYGVLQPLVVTRQETEREDGGISVEYELIAGERRLRASKLARLPQVPVIIRAQEESNKMKLELAIIENLQREDLNAMDRARAFKQLVDEFNLKHIEIAKKVGKSREYVSNTLRLLGLPEYIQNALTAREISEGHARPLLMLGDREQERDTLFTEITTKKLTVRESERIARRIATDKARKQDLSPELIGLEKELTETLGTRVQIEQRSKNGGKVHIDYFSEEDLKRLLDLLAQERGAAMAAATVAAPVVAVVDDAVEKFNDTFASEEPKTVPDVAQEEPWGHMTEFAAAQHEEPQDAPAEGVDPFKQFEIDVAPQAAKEPEDLTSPTDIPEVLVAPESPPQPIPPYNPFAVPSQTTEPQKAIEEDVVAPPAPVLAPVPNPFAIPVANEDGKSDDDLYSMKNFAI